MTFRYEAGAQGVDELSIRLRDGGYFLDGFFQL